MTSASMSAISTAKLLSAALIVAALGGCAQRTVSTTSGPYRTVQAQPLRDTDAARRAHEAGLKHLRDGQIEQAVADFERALAADVEYGPAHNSLGIARFRQHKWYEAAWEFEYARQYMPRADEPLNNLGLIHEMDGQYDQAVEYYRRALGIDGDNVRIKANLARTLLKRGDRTDEVRALLDDILEHDTRPEWLTWAKGWRTRLHPAR